MPGGGKTFRFDNLKVRHLLPADRIGRNTANPAPAPPGIRDIPTDSGSLRSVGRNSPPAPGAGFLHSRDIEGQLKAESDQALVLVVGMRQLG